LRKRLNEACSS